MANQKNKFDLTGKSAIITGGGGLLGKEHGIALALAGANVYLTDIDEKKVQKVSEEINEVIGEERVFSYKMDISKKESVEKIYNQLLDKDVSIDILINNAAIDPKVSDDSHSGKIIESSRLETFSLEQWQIEISVGLTGAFLCAQVFGSAMAERGGGVILNIASDLSVICPDQRIYRKEGVEDELQPVKPVTYSVIKHGLLGLTKYLAGYWADKNIRVNAISPGGVFNGQDEKFVKKLTNLIPLGRMADREEYRSAVQFLCSDASSYMIGQNLVMDGGRSLL